MIEQQSQPAACKRLSCPQTPLTVPFPPFYKHPSTAECAPFLPKPYRGMTESSPPAPSGVGAAVAATSNLEDTLIDKEQVMASFAGIDWGSYGRTTLSADEVGCTHAAAAPRSHAGRTGPIEVTDAHPTPPHPTQVKMLKSCDEKPLDFLLADAGDAKLLVATLVKLLKSVSDQTVQQYALTHVEEILQLENLPQVRNSFLHHSQAAFGVKKPRPECSPVAHNS